MTLKLYEPTPNGLEPSRVEASNWRSRLRSRRWDPAPIENPDVKKTTPLAAILFFAGLAAATFVVLLLGYGSGFWR